MALEDVLFRGMPKVNVDFYDTLYDEPLSDRKYNRNLSFATDQEMHDVLYALAQDPRLPFQANFSTMMRHFAAAGVESLQGYLSSGKRSMWNALQERQQALTTERYAVTIEQQTQEAASNFRFWTDTKEWTAIARGLIRVKEHIVSLPDASWRTHAARGWLASPELRSLRKRWEEEMRFEGPESWGTALRVFAWFEEVARVS